MVRQGGTPSGDVVTDGAGEGWRAGRMETFLGVGWHGLAAFGYAASIFNIASAFMHTMVPLRAFAVATNVCFIIYGASLDSIPITVSHAILLPINIARLNQMLRLSRRVAAASRGGIEPEWLKRYGRELTIRPGETVFHKGDHADCLYFAVEGRFRLAETGIELGRGQVFGELGLFSEANVRTQTLVCIEAGTVLSIAYGDVRQLYFQNPQFGFFLLDLISRRLFQNIELAEQRNQDLLAAARRQEERAPPKSEGPP